MLKNNMILISVLAFAGCMDVDSDVSEDTESPRLAANGLLPADVLATQLDPAILDQAHADALVTTTAGINVAHYLIPCALAPGHDIDVTGVDDLGNPYTGTLHGVHGLADDWTSGALTTAQQRFVSACVLAYTNRIGASVTISMRGPNAAFSTIGSETTNYAVQEGAYFGNLFGSGKNYVGPLACSGSGTTIASGRDCAKPTGGTTQCGYTYAGTCASLCTTSSGYFVNCSYSGTSYTQPLTVFDAI
jgi:hypothetical protein